MSTLSTNGVKLPSSLRPTMAKPRQSKPYCDIMRTHASAQILGGRLSASLPTRATMRSLSYFSRKVRQPRNMIGRSARFSRRRRRAFPILWIFSYAMVPIIQSRRRRETRLFPSSSSKTSLTPLSAW